MITLLVAICLAIAPVVEPAAGTEIRASTTFKPGSYRLAAPNDGAVRVAADDVTLDFTGVELIGSEDNAPADQFAGTAIVVRNAKNVTIKNLKSRGYKLVVKAYDSPNLRITGCDFSNNYRQRLKSTREREHLDDWMYYHHNETDEWLRYGAAMYLKNCHGAQVDRCVVRNGQNALMLVRCDGGTFWNNDFSFNSGVGIGMYRSSRNRVMHNKLDWCVRGYSHGVYHRGQDSAAILVYEQSSNNLFAYNSATHSGDGFFLWAGQSTMDSGQGGCNDNLVYGNDFSCAVANGIEATFSSGNVFANNILDDCDYGIWAGYSHDSRFTANTIRRSLTAAIAIEHGQDNQIDLNTIESGRAGIKLWMRDKQDPNWAYPKHRDTRSRDYRIEFNRIATDVKPAISLRDTLNVTVKSTDPLTDNALRIEGKRDGLRIETVVQPSDGDITPPAPLPDGMPTTLPSTRPRGRQHIVIDEWGPRLPK